MNHRDAVRKDKNHLNLLAIFFYVFAGLRWATVFLSFCYVLFGLMFLFVVPPAPNGPPNEFMGAIFLIAGILIFLISSIWGTMDFLTARWLSKQTHYRFCFVWACIQCLSVPLGTVLGIFTILALSKPEIKAIFEGGREGDWGREPRELPDDSDDTDQRPGEPDEGKIREGRPRHSSDSAASDPEPKD